MYYYDINLNVFKTKQFIDEYIDYLFSKNDITTVLKSLNISSSSYFYAKKNGYTNSPKFMSTIIEKGFYRPIEESEFVEVSDFLKASITESFFADNDQLQAIRKKFLKKYNLYQYSSVEIIGDLVYLNGLDLPLKNENEINKVKTIISKLNFFENIFDNNTRYLFYLSISEFYQASRDINGMRQMMQKMVDIELFVDEQLLLLGYYDMVGMESMLGEFKKTYYYLNECEKLCYKYANFKRLGYLRTNKRFIAFKIGNFEEAYSLAVTDIVPLLRNDEPIILRTTLVILVSSLIEMKKYDEALKHNEIFYTKKLVDYYVHAILFEAYIQYKKSEKTDLKVYIDRLNELCSNDQLYQDGLSLLNSLFLIQNGTKRSIKEAIALLKPIDSNKYSRLNRIATFIRKEYEEYLIKNNKMISIYEMI